MIIKGKLHKVFQTQRIKDSFQKREFVLELNDNPQYPQYVMFEFTQDRCSLLDGYQPGEMVELNFDLRGREWRNPQGEVKYFNTLGAWKINRAGSEGAQSPDPGAWQGSNSGGESTPFEAPSTSDPAGDLPF